MRTSLASSVHVTPPTLTTQPAPPAAPYVPRTRWVSLAKDRPHPLATRAYHKAHAGGFCPGHEMDDWMSVLTELSRQARA